MVISLNGVSLSCSQYGVHYSMTWHNVALNCPLMPRYHIEYSFPTLDSVFGVQRGKYGERCLLRLLGNGGTRRVNV